MRGCCLRWSWAVGRGALRHRTVIMMFALFIKRGVRDYVRLQERRDVIELPIEGDLDINGWDMVKALTQFRKSNPSLLEWLHSPIVYRENGDFASRLRMLAQEHFSPRRMTYHYISMAKSNYRLSIENKAEVSLKKYLYVLRPLCCIRWMEQHQTPPPTSIHDALASIALPFRCANAAG